MWTSQKLFLSISHVHITLAASSLGKCPFQNSPQTNCSPNFSVSNYLILFPKWNEHTDMWLWTRVETDWYRWWWIRNVPERLSPNYLSFVWKTLIVTTNYIILTIFLINFQVCQVVALPPGRWRWRWGWTCRGRGLDQGGWEDLFVEGEKFKIQY